MRARLFYLFLSIALRFLPRGKYTDGIRGCDIRDLERHLWGYYWNSPPDLRERNKRTILLFVRSAHENLAAEPNTGILLPKKNLDKT